MATNARDTVLGNLVTLFKTITTANGYLSNVGSNVERGFKTWNEVPNDMFPYICVHASTESIEHFAAKQKESRLEIDIFAYVKGTRRESIDTDTQALAEDMIKAVGSSERLITAGNTGYVDFPEGFELSSFVMEPFGVLALPLTYVFERNERGQGFVARRWWINNVASGSHLFGAGSFSSVTTLANTPYVQFTELYDRTAAIEGLASSGFTLIDTGRGNAETFACLIYVEENL